VDWPVRAVPSELARRYLDAGWWTDETLGQVLHRGLGEFPETAIRIHSDTRPWSGTFGDVHLLARRLAAGLRSQGIGPGDVVSFQLPNCVEAVVTFYAAAFLGAVVVPIVHFYGPKEVGYILRRTRVRAFVTMDRFGPIDFLANLDRLETAGDLAGVDLVAVVASERSAPPILPEGSVAFDDLVAADPIDGPADVDPDEPAVIGYTSGTTADPKGVIHSHRTVGAEVRQLGSLQAPDAVPNLVGAPVGHAIGMLSALLIPPTQGKPINLVDVWNPPRILELMTQHHLASGSGATFFLTSLLDHPACTDEHLELMRHTGLGGSAVPAAVGERATDLGISIVRMYGATEHPSITGSTHDAPLDKRIHTDGAALDGVEIRLVDDDGTDVEPGEPGEILSRGPDCFVGYTDPDLTATAFDDEGWFHTGDIGILDDDGYLRITDRKKDVIIRGGENISAVEVEEVLMQLPEVAEVAVVAAPDQRFGERVCAVVRAMPGSEPPDLVAVRAATEAAGLARAKWPEDLRLVEEFPRTPSGKVQKVVLRARLREGEPVG
jgi:acyl-CoA synthetase (AMP-forming)/AMP-acid ligase II